jgi:putative glycosyltransferase (TIGR04372 family)
MKLGLKNLLRKNIFFHNIFFEIKIFILKIKYLFTKNKNYKFRILLLQSRYNQAYKFFKTNILKNNNYSFLAFCNYLSLCLRLKIFKDEKKLNKIIFDCDRWSPVIYVFLIKNSKNKLCKEWLEKIFKNNQIFVSILYEPEKFITNEKYFLKEALKSKTTLPEIRVYLKEIISQMYFNDMQFNKLNYFYTLDHMINDYLLNKHSKKNKRLAILNLDPWTQSIGHFYYLDSFIKGVLLGILDYDYIIFSKEPKSVISNKYLFKLYKSFIDKKFIIPKNRNYIVSEPNMEAWRHKNKNIVMAHEISKYIQKIWYKKNNKPIAEIPKKDIKVGDKLIKDVLGDRKWFCTLHVREPGFRLNDHLWLDAGRNANIKNYEKAIKYIYWRGGYTIRLGQKKNKKVKSQGLFDYGSSSQKSDFLDIFLIYRGKFNIGTSSGLSFIPIILGKYKNIFTNLNLLFFISIPGSIGIPKLVYSINKKKLVKMDIHEKFNPPFLFYGNESFKNVGYKLIENSSEDIFLLIKEFLNNFNKKNWHNFLRNRKTFPLNSNNNIYTNNFIPLPKFFIKKYRKLL